MDDELPQPEEDPRLAEAAREARRAAAAADPEDRAFVLDLLEDLARRFRERGPS